MEFKTIQCSKTLSILMYYIDNKRVSEDRFLLLEQFRFLLKYNYCNSLTTRTKTNNFRHTANL
jgi:hypothetical protein